MKYINPISDLLMESVESYQYELISDKDKQINLLDNFGNKINLIKYIKYF